MTSAPTPPQGSPSTPIEPVRPRMSPLLIFIFALATGAFASTLYLAQPILEMIGSDLGMSTAHLGTIVMLTQVGYAAGMFFVAPIADVTENKRLILISVALVVASLVAIAVSTSALMFLLASFSVGLAAVGTQVIVPLAANLATDEKRGAQIGAIMTGLLSGIMLARPTSSFLASIWGWRAPFLFSAAVMTGIGILLAVHTPRFKPAAKQGYLSLLKSMTALLKHTEGLRRRCIYQAVVFGVFNMFWTSSSLVLTDAFGLGYREIAIFAFTAAGGALIAPYAGRLADLGLTRIATGAGLALIVISMAFSIPMVLFGYLLLFALAAVLVDVAVQTNQVLGQATVYANLPTSRARGNALYMTSLFLGGSLGSLIAPVCYAAGGWPVVALVAAGVTLLTILYWATEYLPGRNADQATAR